MQYDIVFLDCKKVSFFSPQSRSLFSASFQSFQTFCLTARAYLNTQKYGLFCSLLCFRLTKVFFRLQG